jgi:hypothetical protein
LKPPFQFHFGPWPAVAISPIAIFGSHHVTKVFTTAQVKTAAGELYIPGEQKFFRYTRADGSQGEESAYDFNFKYRMAIPDGGEMCFTHREIPSECVVTSFFKPEVGKVVQVDALVSGPQTARVVAFGPGYIQLDWSPKSGDSGSLCWGDDGSFAGAVDRPAHGQPGTIISTPPQVGDPMLEGTIAYAPGTFPGSTSPAPTSAPEPPPAPTPVSAPPAPVTTPLVPPLSSGPLSPLPNPAALPADPGKPQDVYYLPCGDSLIAINSLNRAYILPHVVAQTGAATWQVLPPVPQI